MVIIKEANDNGAWWFKTPMDAFKDLQNNFDVDDLPERDTFLLNMRDHLTMYIEGYEVFSAYEGDQ